MLEKVAHIDNLAKTQADQEHNGQDTQVKDPAKGRLIGGTMDLLTLDQAVQLTDNTVHDLFKLDKLSLDGLQLKVLGEGLVKQIIVVADN